MAFNFRAKNKNEIIKKNKKFSAPVAEIFEYIQSKYNETIILDPNTSFSKIKIPRILSDTKNINQIKAECKRIVNITGITLEFGDGSGLTGTDANETAKQENASRLVCEHFIEKNHMPHISKIKKIYKCDDEWYETFYKQAVASKKFLASKGYKFSRDQGIMPLLEKIAKTKCGITKKDAWNPADIFAIKNSHASDIEKKIKQISELKCDPNERLDILNKAMRVWFRKKHLVGISLKKIALNKKNASVEATNIRNTDDIIINDISITGNINCDLSLNSRGEFSTGEMMFKLRIENKSVTVQIRSFSGNQRENTQMDMTEAGAAAKLGKVSLTQAIDPYLASKPVKRIMASSLPKVGKWTENDIQHWIKQYKFVSNKKIGGNTIFFGNVDWESTLRQAIQEEVNNARTASQLSSKLQCFQWIKIFNQFTGDEFKKFITVLYFGAKKQYKSAGPFLKIS